MTGYLAGARALVEAAEGDEPAAAEILRGFLTDHPLTGPIGRRAVTRWLALAYVLLPEARPLIDAGAWGPLHQPVLAGARALVALREGRRAPLDEHGLPALLTSMPLSWSLGVASAAAHADDPAGRQLAEMALELHGENGREALRTLATSTGRRTAPGAKMLLADIALPPAGTIELRVLGPAELLVDGRRTADPNWRRDRVRALLVYLVCRGSARPRADHRRLLA